MGRMRRMHLLAVTIVPLLLVGACGGSDTPDKAEPSASSSPGIAVGEPTPTRAPGTPTPTGPAGELIDYGEDGVTLATADDVSKLEGAPADFTAFIARELAKEQATSDEACTEKPQINVSAIHTGGWASGGTFIPQCGGSRALWARSNGTWTEAWEGQELVDCATLRRYDFPVAVAGDTCLDGDEQRPYTG
jgi:hypothetical protein